MLFRLVAGLWAINLKTLYSGEVATVTFSIGDYYILNWWLLLYSQLVATVIFSIGGYFQIFYWWLLSYDVT